ncbi:AhpC/TSA family protein [Prolixibacteraceae bacterium JC049]|nr:AhpC/TSA family protein [Prolixibacteraceae bacterium JC049]
MSINIRRYLTFSNVLLAFIATLLFSACQEKGNFSISGKITNAKGKTIYLEKLKVESSLPLDSAKVKDDGTFEFTGSVSMPEFFLLKFGDKNFVTLLVDSADNVLVAGDIANFSRDYVVAGSKGSELVRDLTLKLQETTHKLDSLSSLQVLYKDVENSEAQMKQLSEEYNKIVKDQMDQSMKFVKENPFSMASVLALYQKFDKQNYVVQDLQSLKVAASALHSIYPKSEHVTALYNNTLRLMNQQQNLKIQQLIQAAGDNSPDIELPDQNGKTKKLSDFRGKHVLLQFWSAEDINSRVLNPVLAANYKKYKRKGFEIYQVSVDEDKRIWKEAIQKDKLTWTNVGDMKGSNDAIIKYNIRKLPMNYLLDKEGKIIARDLKGPAVGQVLAQIFE